MAGDVLGVELSSSSCSGSECGDEFAHKAAPVTPRLRKLPVHSEKSIVSLSHSSKDKKHFPVNSAGTSI
jgi:hypothetical protein